MSSARAGTALRVLTFEAGGFLFAVRAETVGQVIPTGKPVPPGTSVVDLVGLLSIADEPRPDRGCVVLLKPPQGGSKCAAVTASRANELIDLEGEKLLPLPSYLFSGGNPFLGLFPREEGAIFLLAEPERLLAAAGSR